MSGQGTVRFTVYGDTYAELDSAAEDRLRRFVGPQYRWACSIDASPYIVTGDGEVQSWSGDVSAVLYPTPPGQDGGRVR